MVQLRALATAAAAALLALGAAPLAAQQQPQQQHEYARALDAVDDAPFSDLVGIRCESQSDCGYLPSLACIDRSVCVCVCYCE